MTTEELNEQTKDDWRELGFFYDYDKNNSCWRLTGSKQGLLKFYDILSDYAKDERHAPSIDYCQDFPLYSNSHSESVQAV